MNKNQKKYDLRSIGELREMAGLKQGELASLSGLTQAYLSEIEHGKKALTPDASKKIADAFNKLMKKPAINGVMLYASHLYSNYPKDIQDYAVDLLFEIILKEKILSYITNTKEIPTEEYIKDYLEDEKVPIVSIIRENMTRIQNNVNKMFRDKERGRSESTVYLGIKPRF